MNKILSNFLFVCAEIWKSIGVAQRMSIVLLTILAVVAIGTISYMGTRPNWQVLYSNLDEETASKIYEMVRDDNVPVKLKDSGRTIMVPYEKVNEIRLKAAKAGLPKNEKGTGLELFDNMKMGMTEMQQQIGYQRALQGEIQRMVRKVPGVIDARVMLVLPPKRLFKTNDGVRRKASLMLVLEPGCQLENSQVTAIRNMVAGTVEGMEVDDVTITDNNGRLLARSQSADEIAGGGDAGTMLDVKAKMERTLREKAESILRPLTGDTAVIAVVSADLDFSAGEKVSELYDSEKSVIVSEKVTTDDNAKQSKRNDTPVGTAGNLVSVRNPEVKATPNDTSQQNRKMVENQYVVPKTVERLSIRGPKVRNLSVAVTIERPAGGKARTQEEMDNFKALVSSAVGAMTSPESGRKDTVIVVEQAFIRPPAAPVATVAVPWSEKLNTEWERFTNIPIWRPMTGAVLLVLLYMIFGATFKREHVERFELNRRMTNEELVNITAETVDESIQDPSMPKAPAELVKNKVEMNPEIVAGVLESWLTTGGRGTGV